VGFEKAPHFFTRLAREKQLKPIFLDVLNQFNVTLRGFGCFFPLLLFQRFNPLF